MNECKKYVDSLPQRKREPSKQTIEQYKIDVERMKKNNVNPETLCTTKNTFYKYRAAWAYTYTQLFYQIHKQINKEDQKSEKVYLIEMLKIVTDKIKEFPPDPNGQNLEKEKKGEYRSQWQNVKKDAPESNSKKNQYLPKEWDRKFFNYVLNKKSKYTTVVGVMAITGCRPAELENGFTIGLENDGSIKICIESKKTHGDKYGQKFRGFNVKSDSVEFSYLTDLLKNNNEELWVQVESANALGEQMRKYSKQVFPRMKDVICPYTYRHQFAKKIKSMLTEVGVAVAMGHSNDLSQRYYAAKGNKGTDGFKIDAIEGTREVKTTERSTFEDFKNHKNINKNTL